MQDRNKQKAEDEVVRAKDHELIKQRVMAGKIIDILKEPIIEVIEHHGQGYTPLISKKIGTVYQPGIFLGRMKFAETEYFSKERFFSSPATQSMLY